MVAPAFNPSIWETRHPFHRDLPSVEWCGNVIMKETALACPQELTQRMTKQVVVSHGRKAEVDDEEEIIQESACSKLGVSGKPGVT